MIKKGDLRIHQEKDKDGMVQVSSDPLDLDDYTN